MYCPRCGQQQISSDIKFCSRCGFQMGLVSELLMHNGGLPQLAALYAKPGGIFTRKNGLIFTVLWFIFFVMMMPAFFGIAGVDEAAAISAVFGVFTTIMFLILSLAFLKRKPKTYQLPPPEFMNSMPANLHGGVPQGALPPQQSQPASSYMPPEGGWRGADTGDLARPGSVTEGTTKLLKKDE